MKKRDKMITRSLALITALLVGTALSSGQAFAGDNCSDLGLGNKAAIHAALKAALSDVAPDKAANGGLGNNMWGTIVDRDGKVCAVAFTGSDRNEQWPASRVISAQKANTAASFNLPKGLGGTVDALSTANLWTQAQPGGSLFGLQFSNPVDPSVAFGSPGPGGDARNYGTPHDPLVGRFSGGIGSNDAQPQGMAHHIAVGELNKADALLPGQNIAGIAQARFLAARQIHLA